MATYFDGILNKIGYEEDPTESNDDLTKLARVRLAHKACYFGNPTCRNAARNKLEKYLADPTTHQILPRWEEWTFCFGLKTSNYTVCKKVFELYTEKKNDTILNSLHCTEDPDIIITLLQTIIKNNTLIEKEAVPDVICRVIRQHIQNRLILSYFLSEFVSIKHVYIGDLLTVIINSLYSENQLNTISNFTTNIYNDMHFPYKEYKIEKRLQKFHDIRNKFNILHAAKYDNLNNSSSE